MRAAYKVLASAGFRIEVPNHHLCCGRPLYDFGLLDTAKQYLAKILDALTPQIEAGTPIVVLEPSCASVFRDELVNLFPDDKRAAKLRTQIYLLSEFLVKFAPDYTPPKIDGRIVVHGHCHQKAGPGMRDEMALLKATGAEVELLDSGCCGMAGPFGFEDEKYEVSQTLGERVLLPAVRSNASAIIVSDGFSCCEQITQNTSARPQHLAEVLARGNGS
jgi:Fe-S oxidoreductase